MIKIKKYFRWAKFFFSSRPFYVIFYITSRCNAKCMHCFNWKLIENTAERKELTLDEIEQIAKKWGDTAAWCPRISPFGIAIRLARVYTSV